MIYRVNKMKVKITETAQFEKWYNDLIYKFGHEHPLVIQYGKYAESLDNTNWNKTCLRLLYEAAMEYEIS